MFINDDQVTARDTGKPAHVEEQLVVPNARKSVHALLNNYNPQCCDEPDKCSMTASVLWEVEGEESESENEADEESASPASELSKDGQMAALKAALVVVEA